MMIFINGALAPNIGVDFFRELLPRCYIIIVLCLHQGMVDNFVGRDQGASQLARGITRMKKKVLTNNWECKDTGN